MFDKARAKITFSVHVFFDSLKIRVFLVLWVFSEILLTKRAFYVIYKPFFNAFVMIGMIAVELSDYVILFVLF